MSLSYSKLCIIIPVFNEEKHLNANLDYFNFLTCDSTLIFVDGQSTDKSVAILGQHKFQILQSDKKGRGAQLNAGLVKMADCNALLFMHADTKLPSNYLTLINEALLGKNWGRFNVRINSSKKYFRIIEAFMNWRSCMTGIATGDQAIFFKTHIVKDKLGKLADYPLMEDIYISKQLKNFGRPACIKTPVITSSRYWEKHGVFKAIIKMWVFRLMFFFGASPDTLYKNYYK
ncbi:MAG: TIGR04283 family arsenosugar biosynthesis glycosyltransferase [Pseudomonadota bacterium]